MMLLDGGAGADAALTDAHNNSDVRATNDDLEAIFGTSIRGNVNEGISACFAVFYASCTTNSLNTSPFVAADAPLAAHGRW